MSFGPPTAIIRPGAAIVAAIQGARGIPGKDGLSITGPVPWTPPAPWQTLRAYVIGPPASTVTIGGSTFVCVIAHTATTFAADYGSGYWAQIASIGLTGQPGSMWYEGAGVPASTTGVTGDYWFQTDTADIFRKADAGWGQPVANIKGLKGDVGPSGRTVLTGTGAPANTLGSDGDLYFDLTPSAPRIFGPRANGAWPVSGISLIAGSGTVNPTGAFTPGHLLGAATADGKTIQDLGAPGDAAFKNTGVPGGVASYDAALQASRALGELAAAGPATQALARQNLDTLSLGQIVARVLLG